MYKRQDLEFLAADEHAHRPCVQAEFAYVAEGDEVAAVDADEAAGSPAVLQGGHRDADEVAAPVGVQTGVVALGLDVGDVVDGHEPCDTAEFDGDVVGVGFVHGYPRCGAAEFGRPAHRLREPFLADRFQDVVDCLEIEGLYGEVLVRGDEHDERRLGETGQQPCHVEAVEARHLDVEEHDVNGFRSVRA